MRNVIPDDHVLRLVCALACGSVHTRRTLRTTCWAFRELCSADVVAWVVNPTAPLRTELLPAPHIERITFLVGNCCLASRYDTVARLAEAAPNVSVLEIRPTGKTVTAARIAASVLRVTLCWPAATIRICGCELEELMTSCHEVLSFMPRAELAWAAQFSGALSVPELRLLPDSATSRITALELVQVEDAPYALPESVASLRLFAGHGRTAGVSGSGVVCLYQQMSKLYSEEEDTSPPVDERFPALQCVAGDCVLYPGRLTRRYRGAVLTMGDERDRHRSMFLQNWPRNPDGSEDPNVTRSVIELRVCAPEMFRDEPIPPRGFSSVIGPDMRRLITIAQAIPALVATDRSALRNLTHLDLRDHEQVGYGAPGLAPLIASGGLPSLREVFFDHSADPCALIELFAACGSARNPPLIMSPPWSVSIGSPPAGARLVIVRGSALQFLRHVEAGLEPFGEHTRTVQLITIDSEPLLPAGRDGALRAYGAVARAVPFAKTLLLATRAEQYRERTEKIKPDAMPRIIDVARCLTELVTGLPNLQEIKGSAYPKLARLDRLIRRCVLHEARRHCPRLVHADCYALAPTEDDFKMPFAGPFLKFDRLRVLCLAAMAASAE